MLSLLQRSYFTLYHVIKNFRIRLISGNMLGVSKAGDATLCLTALQVLNVRFLLAHVFYADARGCHYCTEFTRQGLLVVIGAGLGLFNMVVFWGETEDRVTVPRAQLVQRVVLAYAVASVILGFV